MMTNIKLPTIAQMNKMTNAQMNALHEKVKIELKELEAKQVNHYVNSRKWHIGLGCIFLVISVGWIYVIIVKQNPVFLAGLASACLLAFMEFKQARDYKKKLMKIFIEKL